jgi:hypothetical protein
MRPSSIVYFERLYLFSLVIGLMMAVFSWDLSVETARAEGFGPGFLVFVQTFSFLIPLILTLLVSRRASVVAKWILVVIFLGGLGIMAATAKLSFAGGVLLLVQIVQILMQAIAIALLFTEESRRWFREGPNRAA